MSGTETPQLCPVLICARPDEFTSRRRLVVTPMNTCASWLFGSTVVESRRTLPSTSPAPITLIRAVWLTASFWISRVGTMPTRSNSPRAMMENSASPLPEAIAPTDAVEAEITPPTGACTVICPPSGRVSFASTWPAVTLSPASTITSATFSPIRSGRTWLSSRGMMVPETSTILAKQDFAALRTVTAAPFDSWNFTSSGRSTSVSESPDRMRTRSSPSRSGAAFFTLPAVPSGVSSVAYCRLMPTSSPSPK